MKAFIFARGGSKGVPKKNIKPINGRPLLEISILQALSVEGIDEVIVSTDCDEIADIAKACGAKVPFMRPAELSTDAASELDAWKHAIRKNEELFGELPDPFISIPTTAPLRDTFDVKNCIDAYFETSADLVICCTASHHSPWFNMVEMDDENTVNILLNQEKNIHRRQDSKIIYNITTVAYVGNPNYLLNATHLLEGKIKGIEVPYERALDIDNDFDFLIAEKILADKMTIEDV